MVLRDWSRLARYVRERRDELGFTQEEIAGRGGPSTATIRLIEGGEQESHRSYRAKSLRQLAQALEWTPGSPLAILNGREPQAASAAEPRHPATQLTLVPVDNVAAERRQFAEQWAEMITTPVRAELREVKAAIDAAPPGAAGHDIFPGVAALADIWDLRKVSPQERMLYMAVWLFRRNHPEQEKSVKAG